MSAKLAARGIATAAAGGVEAAPAGAVPAAGGGGDVTSRADVARTLDRLCEYYRVHEPSSPIPLLLQRAKRLVDKDFLSILRDLAPSGVAEAESLGGVEKGSE
jgi:type VI secretion system protein ImpA